MALRTSRPYARLRVRRGAAILAFVVAQITATSIYALAADGPGWVKGASAPISGLHVKGVDYELDRENPYLVERVSFRVEGLPSGFDIDVQLNPTGEWFRCTAREERATCETPGTTAESATRLSVVIAG